MTGPETSPMTSLRPTSTSSVDAPASFLDSVGESDFSGSTKVGDQIPRSSASFNVRSDAKLTTTSSSDALSTPVFDALPKFRPFSKPEN